MKKIKLFLVLGLGSLLSVSCLVDDDVDQLGGGSTTIVGYPNTELSATFVTDGQDYNYNVPIHVIGGNEGLPSGSDITVNYVLNTDESTAVEGTEFNFVSATRSVTIPAGSFSTLLPIVVHSDELVVGDNKTVVIDITSVVSNEGVVVATNYDSVTIELVGACFSNLAGNYVVNYTSGTFPVTITQVGIGQYVSSVTPGYTTYEMYFSDVCGVLTITDWYADSQYPISGTGVVTPAGNLSFTSVTIQGIYDNRSYTFVRQ